MKNLAIAAVLVVLAGCRTVGPRASFAMDWSGVDAFWPVYETLHTDNEPSAEMWDRLWTTPGYAKFNEREKRREILSEAYRVAYMPSRAEEREQTIRTGKHPKRWIAVVLRHLIEVPEHRAELDAFRARFEREHLFEQALDRAQTKLPPGVTRSLPPPAVSMAYIAGGRGYDRIILDPLETMQHPNVVGLLAHELHHHYRNATAREGKKEVADDLLAWALINVEVEGIASTLDKGEVPRLSDANIDRLYVDRTLAGYMKSYRDEYARSAYWLQYFDGRLQRVVDDPADAAEIGKDLHDTPPDNARMVGAFMADTIDAQLGRSRLAAAVGDPYAFWKTYNDAAARSGGKAYVLSSKAMDAIDAKRRQYMLP